MTSLWSLQSGRARCASLLLIQLYELTRFLDLGHWFALTGAMTRYIAFASVCGAAVFFMLVFLRALLREARSRARITEIRFPERREGISATPSTVEPSPTRLDQAA